MGRYSNNLWAQEMNIDPAHPLEVEGPKIKVYEQHKKYRRFFTKDGVSA